MALFGTLDVLLGRVRLAGCAPMTRVTRAHAAAAVVLLGAVAVTLYAGLRLRGTYVGDAAVYLPYARNAARGHPFEFNLGEFSSGSTSPLWSLALAIPHLLGLGIAGAKALAGGVAALAVLAVAYAARALGATWLAAAVAALFCLGTMTFPALAMYESGLVVALAALALVAGRRATAGGFTRRDLVPLAVIWAALPLARPDAVILVAAQAAALLALAPRPRRRAAAPLAAALALAALPSAAYFGYSLAELGVFSTSSEARTFALREVADPWLGPLYLSDGAIRELAGLPWLIGLLPALAGLVLLWRDPRTRTAALTCVLAIAGYVALLTFVAPGVYDTARYLLPLVPAVVAGAAGLLSALPRGAPRAAAAVLAALLIGGTALAELRDVTRLARSIGITQDEVFETDVTAMIEAEAAPGDELLAYEVQLRYFLRDDVTVISLDGITDPRVHPFQERRDLTGFLRRYRPRWWIADRNVTSRPYLRGSVLERALLAFRGDPAAQRMVLDGIGFRVVAKRTRPLAAGFGGWEMLFELDYPA